MTSDTRPTPADPAGTYAKALDATRRFVAGIRPEQWSDATPCTEWNVRELLNHMIYGTIWIEPIFDGKTLEEVGDRYDGDLVGADALASYDAAAASAKRAVAAPGAMEVVCHISRGDVSGAQYATSMFTDVFIHGWDLAKATGQEPALNADLLLECAALVEPGKERFRNSAAFGNGGVPDPPDGSDLQTRVLAILGRAA